MPSLNNRNNRQTYKQARLSRDPRFDGLFFTAVKTTGIYCRSICPASPPKEENVDYYSSAAQAAAAGFRPCLRCRPDSAPHSAAWQGSQATLNRAVRLIRDGALEQQSMAELASYLGISDRYLRRLFKDQMGVSPKVYALYQQCLFAKQLLHQTTLPIGQIALASGFNSIRRFNDCFKQNIKVTPSDIRRKTADSVKEVLSLKLFYRPPYDWSGMHQFWQGRILPAIETLDDNSYQRSFEFNGQQGSFKATHQPEQHCFDVAIQLADLKDLRQLVNNIRRILDLDANTEAIESHLKACVPNGFVISSGLRIPGIWDAFEAGIRAILGQQVSIQAARNLLNTLVENTGQQTAGLTYFPTPRDLLKSDLACLKMPGSRKATLHRFANHMIKSDTPENPDEWLAIKGIGPWTVNYIRMRGLSDPDVFLTGDSGIKNALRQFNLSEADFDASAAAPWRSYLTFQLWRQ